MSDSVTLRRMTLDDLAEAEAAGRRVELIDGVLVDREAAGTEHGAAHGSVSALLGAAFSGRDGSGRPRGWTFLVNPTIALLEGNAVLPDVAAWRLERAPVRGVWPVAPTPDWACEVSYSTLSRDVAWKLREYHRVGIAHYWVLDVRDFVFIVYRLTPDGYLVALTALAHETVRAEPFDAIEIPVWELFGLLDAPAK